MSTPNAPQGSPLEQAAKGSSLAAKITFITLAHLAVIGGGLVFYGCSKTPPDSSNTGAPTNNVATLNPSDVVSPAPFTDTNAIVAPADASPTGPIGGTAAPGIAPAAGPGVGAGPVSPVVNPSSPLTTPLPLTTPDPATSPIGGAGATSEYKVQKGDTGSSIAKKHGVSLGALKSANPAVNWNKLKINQAVQIPAGGAATTSTPAATPDAPEHTTAAPVIHVVKANDTLTSISRKYGVPWKQIRSANGLKSENIKVGDKLKIPAKKESHAAKPAAAPSAPAAITDPPAGSTIAPLSPLPLTPEPSAQPLPTRPSGNPPQ